MIEIGIVFVLVVFNGFFALSEMAVITSRKSRLKQFALTSQSARAALDLAENPEQFLSAVQVWITLLGLMTGYFGGESIGGKLAGPIAHVFPILAPYSHWIGFATGFMVMVFLYGVIGELLPKRLGTLHSERIAMGVAMPMKFFANVAKPGVIIMSGCTNFLMRLFRVSASEDKVTDEEIRHLVAESHEQGMIDSDERNMLNRVLRLGDRSAESLMTPRPLIIWLDAEESIEENLATLREHPLTRYPVYRKDDSNVIGILESKSLVGRLCDSNESLFQTLNTVLYVSESTHALRLLEIFREEQQNMAMVVDEYGDIMGMVTMNDLIGAILGRIQSMESAEYDPLVVKRDNGSWLVDGRLAIEELHELLNLQTLPGEDDSDFTTVAGMVIAHFGRIPHSGEYFDFSSWRVEVVDLDGARIDKLLIGKTPDIEPAFDE